MNSGSNRNYIHIFNRKNDRCNVSLVNDMTGAPAAGSHWCAWPTWRSAWTACRAVATSWSWKWRTPTVGCCDCRISSTRCTATAGSTLGTWVTRTLTLSKCCATRWVSSGIQAPPSTSLCQVHNTSMVQVSTVYDENGVCFLQICHVLHATAPTSVPCVARHLVTLLFHCLPLLTSSCASSKW